MALSEGQVKVGDLLMGPGTLYDLQDEVNPLVLSTRADQGGSRAWNHGTWSGAEWVTERVIPLRMIVNGSARTVATWMAANQQGAAAFAAIGDSTQQVEFRFNFAGTEYVLFGRPRMWEPDLSTIGLGYAYTRAAFVAQDPRIYAGTESTTGAVSLPTQTGGLTVPGTGGLQAPFTVDGELSGGTASLVNAGTTDTGLLVRIDGPVASPRIVLQRPDGTVQQIRFNLTLADGQWLDVDTAARTALLNGLPGSNQRGRAVWDVDPFPLPPGTTEMRFMAGSFDEDATATATWRSAFW